MATRPDVPRGVIDTSVLVAGIAGFKPHVTNPNNPSALLLRRWLDEANFVWLVSEEIVDEYKCVLGRLGVRRHLPSLSRSRQTQQTTPFARVPKSERHRSSQP